MNIKNHIHYSVVAVLFFTSFISAQIKIHKTLSAEDGLVQGQVASMMQDSKGYIWFGTFDGVSRWDGINFFNIQTHNGLPASQIMDIEEWKDSTIYIAAYGGGIVVYKNEILDTIDTEDGLSSNNITQIITLKDGGILFAGDDGNITKLHNGILENWAARVGFPKYDIFDLQKSDDETLYFATEKGLVIVKDDKCSVINEDDGLITEYIWSVNVNNEGIVYIGTNRGINKLSDGKVSEVYLNGKLFQNAVYKILVTNNGRIYYASNRGILVEDENGTEILTVENGLAHNNSWTLMEDENGMMYFGSNGKGVSIYNPEERIISFNKSTGLLHDKVLSITESNAGEYFFGTRNGLIKYKSGKFKYYSANEGERGDIIDVVHKNKDGEILLGTKIGLKVFKDESIKPYIENEDLLNNEIFSIAECKSGKLYLGTFSGVYLVKGNFVERLVYFDSFSSIFIMTILVTKNDDIIFGSFDKGLFIYQNGNFTNITTDDGLSTNRINCIYQRKDGTILVGTPQGLNILKDFKVIKIIDVNDGLNNNSIADINEDEKGRIFLSTYKGINIIRNLDDSLSIRYITSGDGLINNSCLIGGSYLDKTGNLWISTQEGLSKYNLNRDNPVKSPPKIYFTKLEVFNEEFPINKFEEQHQFKYDQNYIKIWYSGINLTAPEKIIYEYRLSNVDRQWTRTIDNSVQYTSLDDGDYLFEVKARNEWGYWSEAAQFSFTIHPVWWKTWWFTTVLGFALIGSLLFIFNKRIKYLEKETRVQEEFSKRLIQSQEDERKRIAAGLHDSLGQNLLVIKNRALLGIKHDKNDFLKEQLYEISSTASYTLDEVRQIAYDLHPYQLSRLGLTKAIKSIITNIKDSTNINFMDNLENIDNLFAKEDEINIYRIVQENINNIVKHSKANNASVKIEKDGSSIIILIEDDGKGFNQEKTMHDKKTIKGFGLENIKKRIALLKGEFLINSKNGTYVKIKFPIKNK